MRRAFKAGNKCLVVSILKINQDVALLDITAKEEHMITSVDLSINSKLPNPSKYCVHTSMKYMLNEVLNRLPNSKKKIIQYRFGLNDDEPSSLEVKKIASRIAMTRERVRRAWAILVGFINSVNLTGAFAHA